MPKAKYGVTAARFYTAGSQVMVSVKYRNRRAGEIKTVTFPANNLGKNTNLEINDFLVDLIDRYENLGGD